MRRYTLLDVRENIKNALKASEEENIEVLSLLKLNHTLMWWAMAMGLMSEMARITEDNVDVNIIEPFWKLLEEKGIYLNQSEKEDVFKNFLDD